MTPRDPDDLIIPASLWNDLLYGIVGLVVLAVSVAVWALR